MIYLLVDTLCIFLALYPVRKISQKIKNYAYQKERILLCFIAFDKKWQPELWVCCISRSRNNWGFGKADDVLVFSCQWLIFIVVIVVVMLNADVTVRYNVANDGKWQRFQEFLFFFGMKQIIRNYWERKPESSDIHECLEQKLHFDIILSMFDWLQIVVWQTTACVADFICGNHAPS